MDERKRIVVDVDGVLAKKDEGEYANKDVDPEVLARLKEYEAQGFDVILYTARNMRTYDGRVGRINAKTAPVLLDWLDEHDIPYTEIHYGKPWCGYDGFYVDDKAIRPDEFAEMTHEEIHAMLDDAER